MKKLTFTLVICITCFAAFAQDDSTAYGKDISHYVFKNFIQGTVKQKLGPEITTLLNYNTLTEEMIFDQEGNKLALGRLDNIDTVYVGGKIFFPVGNVFYEKATNTPIALYIHYKTNIIPPGKDIGYGSQTQTGSVSNARNMKGDNKFYNLTLPDDFKLRPATTYWVKKEDKYVELNSIKKVQALFPLKAAAIKEFAKANKISFDNPDDVTKLIIFCN